MSNVVKGLMVVVRLSVLCAVGGLAGWALWSGQTEEVGGPVAAATPSAEAPENVAVAPSAEGVAAVARIRAAGVLRVAMDTGEPPWTGTPPMYSKDAAGKDTGFDVEVARVIAAALGVSEVQVVHARYSELPALLADPANRADLLISGYSPTETPDLVWSDSYLDYGLCLVVPAQSKVKSTKDLFGQAVGIFDDDAAADDVATLVQGYTELVRLEDGYWDQLLAGRFAGFIYDYPYAVAEINRFYAQNPHRKGAFRIAQYNLSESFYAVGLRSTDAALLPIVDAAVGAWQESPAYGEALRAWLSSGLAADAPADSTKKTVKVAAGDSLSKIAARELGSASKWTELWAVNKDRFPNPHLIEVGDLVLIP